SFATAFAAKAALPVAAESRRRVEQVRGIDPHHAALELRGDVEREVDALRPDAGREPVWRVVRQRDGLFRRAERHRDEHGPEDLDLRDHARGRDVGDQRGWVQVALRWTRT